MGITIHWSGEVDNKETADKIISYAKFFAESLGWPVEYVKYPSVAYKDYTYMSGHMEKPAYTHITNHDEETYKRFRSGHRDLNPRYTEEAEKGETEGVIINPPKPFNTESIAIEFYPWKGKYRMGTFCKTQVFNDKEIANVIAHELIISMLETIKSTWMPNLHISDEGDYYKKSRHDLNKDIKYWKKNDYPEKDIARWVTEWKETEPHNFETLMKSHGSNLAVIHGMGKTLEKTFKGTDVSLQTPAQKEKSFLEELAEKDEKKESEEKKNDKKRLHS